MLGTCWVRDRWANPSLSSAGSQREPLQCNPLLSPCKNKTESDTPESRSNPESNTSLNVATYVPPLRRRSPATVGAESEGPVITSCPTPPPAAPHLATRWRPDGGHVCSALPGPHFVEPLQWKVTEDCQVLLTCKANPRPRPRLQPRPQGGARVACPGGCPCPLSRVPVLG